MSNINQILLKPPAQTVLKKMTALDIVDSLIQQLIENSTSCTEDDAKQTKNSKPQQIQIDVSSVTIRETNASNKQELSQCDRIVAFAFGTLKGIDISTTSEFGFVTNRRYYDQIYIAEYNNKIIGCILSINYGCFRIMGPLAVLPKYWKNKVASALLSHFLKSDKPIEITRDVLFTFCNSYHTKFYRKFGYQLRFLTYITTIDVQISIKNVSDRITEYVLSQMDRNNANIEDIYDACVQLCDSEYKGLNPLKEIKGILKYNNEIGQVLALFNKNTKMLVGFVICHYSDLKKNGLWVKFGIAKDLNCLEIMILELIKYANKINIKSIQVGINTGRIKSFDLMTNKLGFQYDEKHANIAMGLIANNDEIYDDYNTPNSCILGDWR